MQRLRQIHLYLGCLFAPLLVFFALSGLWQNYFLHYSNQQDPHPRLTHAFALLSTLHTGRSLKSAGLSNLSSGTFRFFVTAMTLSLLLTMVLGLVMAFRFGRARVATACLLTGVAVPLAPIALVIFAA